MHCVFNLDNIFSFCVLFNSSYSTRLRSSPLFRTMLNRLPAPLCSMGDGVVVAGSLSFQGHFHSLTPGSLSTVQTFTQSLLVRIAMNSMPLYEEPADMTGMLVICQLNIQDQTWKSFDNIAVSFNLNLFAKVCGNKKGSPDFFLLLKFNAWNVCLLSLFQCTFARVNTVKLHLKRA